VVVEGVRCDVEGPHAVVDLSTLESVGVQGLLLQQTLVERSAGGSHLGVGLRGLHPQNVGVLVLDELVSEEGLGLVDIVAHFDGREDLWVAHLLVDQVEQGLLLLLAVVIDPLLAVPPPREVRRQLFRLDSTASDFLLLKHLLQEDHLLLVHHLKRGEASASLRW